MYVCLNVRPSLVNLPIFVFLKVAMKFLLQVNQKIYHISGFFSKAKTQ